MKILPLLIVICIFFNCNSQTSEFYTIMDSNQNNSLSLPSDIGCSELLFFKPSKKSVDLFYVNTRLLNDSLVIEWSNMLGLELNKDKMGLARAELSVHLRSILKPHINSCIAKKYTIDEFFEVSNLKHKSKKEFSRYIDFMYSQDRPSLRVVKVKVLTLAESGATNLMSLCKNNSFKSSNRLDVFLITHFYLWNCFH